jgi:hypothetical protein
VVQPNDTDEGSTWYGVLVRSQRLMHKELGPTRIRGAHVVEVRSRRLFARLSVCAWCHLVISMLEMPMFATVERVRCS